MTHSEKERISRLRQDLRCAFEQMEAMLPQFLARRPLVKGTLYRKSASAGGRREAFCCSEQGRTRHISLPSTVPKALRTGATNYRRFRTARAHLCRHWRAMLRLVDQIEQMRRIPLEDVLSFSDTATERQRGDHGSDDR